MYNDQNYTTKRKPSRQSLVWSTLLNCNNSGKLYAKSFFSYVFLDRHVFSSCNETMCIWKYSRLYITNIWALAAYQLFKNPLLLNISVEKLKYSYCESSCKNKAIAKAKLVCKFRYKNRKTNLWLGISLLSVICNQGRHRVKYRSPLLPKKLREGCSVGSSISVPTPLCSKLHPSQKDHQKSRQSRLLPQI